MVSDFLKKLRIVLSETFSSFLKNNDLSAASSLAFSATLALIPALFLLTVVLGAAIGSSARALARTQDLLTQVIPAYSQEILREVGFITAHKGAIGLVNSLVMLWSITPLVADLRVFLGTVFRKKPTRPFFMEKLFDAAISLVFLIGLAAVGAAGVVFTLAERWIHLRFSMGHFEGTIPFLFVSAVVFSLYLVFSSRSNIMHLLSGALAASLLWFAMRPLFHVFLTFNPGYGFAFGSFKSLFVVIIWIYCSLVVFLLGAELAASLGRKETVFIRKLMLGDRRVPAAVSDRYVARYERDGVIFSEGDRGNAMYSVLKGSVGLRRNGKEIAVVRAGSSFGEVSYLLSAPRIATAVALEDVELVAVGGENINNLMNEFPEFVMEMLREMALRLRESNNQVD